MADKNDRSEVTGMGGLARGLLRYLQESAVAPPWVERKKTGAWPKAEISELKQMTLEMRESLGKEAEKVDQRYKARRDGIKDVVEKRRERLEAYTKRLRQVVPSGKDRFVVAGRVMDKATGVGLPNLKVNAFDLDRKYDDRLGITRTDALGYFRIEYTSADFKDFGDKMPETYIEIIGEDGGVLFTSPKSFVQKAGKTKFIDAPVDGEKAPNSRTIADKINLSVKNRLNRLERRKKTLICPDMVLVRGKASGEVKVDETPPKKPAPPKKRKARSTPQKKPKA